MLDAFVEQLLKDYDALLGLVNTYDEFKLATTVEEGFAIFEKSAAILEQLDLARIKTQLFTTTKGQDLLSKRGQKITKNLKEKFDRLQKLLTYDWQKGQEAFIDCLKNLNRQAIVKNQYPHVLFTALRHVVPLDLDTITRLKAMKINHRNDFLENDVRFLSKIFF